MIVVGGGFAGVAAARELRSLGHEPTIVEGRDRLGGRTWTDRRFGHELEMGGTWIHWHQPHVWSEISRYGLALTESPWPEEYLWLDDTGEILRGSVDDLFQRLQAGMQGLLRDAREVFPRPYEPLYARDRVEEVDEMSVVDRLDELGLGPPERELVRWLWSQNFNGPCSEGALSLALRWDAFGGYDWLGLLEACARYKIVGGTRSLLEAIVGDAAATVHLSSPVARIAQSETEVVVGLRDGRELTGAAALVTVPVNALGAIEFAPLLSSAKRAAIEEGQLSQGVKAWVHIRGAGTPFLALASDEHPLMLLQYERATSDGYLAFAFGADARKLDGTDSAIEDAVRIWLPEAQVVEWACHDWVADEFSRETWATFRPGWLTRHAEALQEPEGRVLLAGSDYANGWVGFIDGAIESGIRVARQISRVIDADLSAR